MSRDDRASKPATRTCKIFESASKDEVELLRWLAAGPSDVAIRDRLLERPAFLEAAVDLWPFVFKHLMRGGPEAGNEPLEVLASQLSNLFTVASVYVDLDGSPFERLFKRLSVIWALGTDLERKRFDVGWSLRTRVFLVKLRRKWLVKISPTSGVASDSQIGQRKKNRRRSSPSDKLKAIAREFKKERRKDPTSRKKRFIEDYCSKEGWSASSLLRESSDFSSLFNGD